MIPFRIFEKLDPRKHDIGDYIDDFMKSDAPQFKGKSKEKIRDMALAAYRAARKEAGLKEKLGMSNFRKLSDQEREDLYKLTNLALRQVPQSPKQKATIAKINKLRAKAKMELINASTLKEGDGLWANIHKKRKSGKRMRKPGEKGAPTAADFKRARGENVEEGKGKPESFEAQFKRRVVKTTKPEHKEKGYNWRIKGKDRPEISIKLYKQKPGFAEFKKQLRRVAGHEFG